MLQVTQRRQWNTFPTNKPTTQLQKPPILITTQDEANSKITPSHTVQIAATLSMPLYYQLSGGGYDVHSLFQYFDVFLANMASICIKTCRPSNIFSNV